MRSKRIELKTLPPSSPDKNDGINYKKLLDAQFSRPGAQGLSVGQLRTRLALLTSLSTAEGFWDISYQDHQAFVRELEAEKWSIVSPNIVQFIDDIRDAPDAIAFPPIEFVGPKQIEAPTPEIEELEEKLAPQSSSGFLD